MSINIFHVFLQYYMIEIEESEGYQKMIDGDCSIDGMEFLTYRDIERTYGFPRNSITRYMREHNATVEEAVEHYKNKPRWFVNGKEYPSLSEVCREYKLNRSCVRVRLDRGMSIEDIVSGKCEMPYTYDGKKFKYLKDIAKYVGIPFNTIQSCMKRRKIDFTHAIEVCKMHKKMRDEKHG